MTEKEQRPLISVTEKGRDFRMTDCEFQMGQSERPILETNAENTRIEKTKVTTNRSSSSSWWSKFGWKVVAPLVAAVVSGLLLYLLIGKT